MKIVFTIVLVWVASGECTTFAANTLSGDNLTNSATGPKHGCTDAQSLIGSLHIQKIELNDETRTEFLNSIGLKVYPEKYFDLDRAIRISGECAIHLKSIHLSTLHFDTDVTLMIVKEDGLTPSPNKHYPQRIIENDDAGTKVLPPHIIKAVEVGYRRTSRVSNFIGMRKDNGISVFAPYSKGPSGEFLIYDDLLESREEIIAIRLFPGLTPSGRLLLLIPDGNSRVLLTFMWTYRDFLLAPWNGYPG